MSARVLELIFRITLLMRVLPHEHPDAEFKEGEVHPLSQPLQYVPKTKRFDDSFQNETIYFQHL